MLAARNPDRRRRHVLVVPFESCSASIVFDCIVAFLSNFEQVYMNPASFPTDSMSRKGKKSGGGIDEKVISNDFQIKALQVSWVHTDVLSLPAETRGKS